MSVLKRSISPRIRFFILLLTLGVVHHVEGHQAPYSIIRLDIKSDGVNAELELPLRELELAFGKNLTQNSETLIQRLGPELRQYIQSHIHPLTANGSAWFVEVKEIVVVPAEQTSSGPFQEIKVQVWMIPPAQTSTRTFTLDYDVILHEVINHYAMISIRKDWESGINENNALELGVIQRDAYNKIPPFHINQQATRADGFKNMFSLGMRHIAEGTDHLLFLLTLLLSAPLIAAGGKWISLGTTRYSLIRITYVISAFTIGHSLTLLIGSLKWVTLPGQPIEVAIALSILVSAIHAVRPLFPGKESMVAALFGLIHGLAFADTLSGLDLDAGQMALTILGFNFGIEVMQLFIIVLIMPWLLLLSKTSFYKFIRIVGASLAMIAATGWISERILEKENIVTHLIGLIEGYTYWMIVGFAFTAVTLYLFEQRILRDKQPS